MEKEFLADKALRVGLEYFASRRMLPKLRKIYHCVLSVYQNGADDAVPYFFDASKLGSSRFYLDSRNQFDNRVFFEKSQNGIFFFPAYAFSLTFGSNERTLKKHMPGTFSDLPE